MIIRYLRDKDGRPHGCVIRTDDGRIGWSLCMKKDTFVKKLGRKIAQGRAENGTKKQMPWELCELANEIVDYVNAKNN